MPNGAAIPDASTPLRARLPAWWPREAARIALTVIAAIWLAMRLELEHPSPRSGERAIRNAAPRLRRVLAAGLPCGREQTASR